MFRSRYCNWAAAIILLPASVAISQDKPSRLTFDVASIRPSQPDQDGGGIKPLPNGTGYIAQNMSVKAMISIVYRIPMRQVTGGPDWTLSDPYDVEAKTEQSYNIDDLHIMFQHLLEDRFDLKLRKEIKEGPVYELLVAKSGIKMKLDERGKDLNIPITSGVGDEVTGTQVPMDYLCYWLGLQLRGAQRPVINKTGLDKTYDFKLAFLPELPPNMSRDSLPPEFQNLPSVFEALKDQLGLELRPARGPFTTLVIDHIDRPSPN